MKTTRALSSYFSSSTAREGTLYIQSGIRVGVLYIDCLLKVVSYMQ